MNTPLHARSLRVYQLAIPLRFRFEHAAATRDTADPIVVELAAGSPFAQHVGYGETLARSYVTGETPESVLTDLSDVFVPRLRSFEPQSFAEALEFIEALPTQVGGRVITAARAAVELALLDLACRVFQRRPTDVAGWLGLPGFGPPGCRAAVRYSGIVVGGTEGRLKTLLRLQRLYGLRDFKLKVGVVGWEQRLAWAHEVLGPAIVRGKVTLRADANGAWSLAQAQEASATLERFGVCALEQPLSDAADADLPRLADQTKLALGVDESLLTVGDAQRLIQAGGVRLFNLRIAKNGGLLPALRIARLALAAGLDVQLGCLVGETSLLSAAGVAFLEICPKVRFVEGAFGPFLLRADIARRPVRFGFGGRIRGCPGPGLGVVVDRDALRRLALVPPRLLNL
ncbi:MAG: enolase C-terminal domain-like protein [Planctomycetota bacterium]